MICFLRSYSWKERCNGITNLLIIDRVYGLIRYASFGWPASYNDLSMFTNCSLFNTSWKQNYFKEKYGKIIGDQGFFSTNLDFVVTPIANNRGTSGSLARWNELTPVERQWSKRISAIEARIENVFGAIFGRKYVLVKREECICKHAESVHPQIIKAACILYNLEVLHGKTNLFASNFDNNNNDSNDKEVMD